ncbi:3-oxoacyl-[acyl-carrier protein] reductase [Deinococcus marmoris]|uniref:3-oxoacyl-[acyl-carrier protein] reductase n=2 Tax=Deinococcus marmoris TaxID=249408 RepID=A0A1U7NTJ8_9DEIO|nr:3-oxoacyl-[acyl-carrier protein] reductase [Deinococcus marmoris]
MTGAAGGIGSVWVKRFLGNGDTVIDTEDGALSKLRDGQSDPAKLVTVATETTSDSDCDRLAEAARSQFGRVDAPINCAGFFPVVASKDMTGTQWRQVIDTNLTGTFLMTQAILPLMKARAWGRTVNFGSGAVFDGTKLQSHHVEAKAGVVGFSRSLAHEIGGNGITVNVITPGLTGINAVRDHFPEELLAAQRAGRAIARDEVPEDLVGPVFFLASPDADFSSGQILNVDGGHFMV